MKEERQLREPKPQVHVQHPWNQDYLEKRDSHWGHVITRKGSDIGATRAKLGMSVPELKQNHCRSGMLANRRTQDALHAMHRQQEVERKQAASQAALGCVSDSRPPPNQRIPNVS